MITFPKVKIGQNICDILEDRHAFTMPVCVDKHGPWTLVEDLGGGWFILAGEGSARVVESIFDNEIEARRRFEVRRFWTDRISSWG